MRQLTNANDIKKHYNFLFFDAQGELLSSQLSAMVWDKRVHPEMTANRGTYIPATMVNAASRVPITKQFVPVVDLELHFFVDEPKYIRLEGLELMETPYTIQELFHRAIENAGGAIENTNSTKGYITHAFKGQSEPNIYEVVKTGDFITVKQQKKKGEAIFWEPQNLKSPRTKAIVNIFESQILNGTLQSTL